MKMAQKIFILVLLFAFVCFNPVSSKYGKKCFDSSDCKSYEFCFGGNCVCIGSSNATTCARILGANCSKEDTLIVNGQCVNGTVHCLPGFARGDMYNCINVNVPVGGICIKDHNCKDVNAICMNNICTCVKETAKIKGKSYCKVNPGPSKYGNKCLDLDDCLSYELCFGGVCVCAGKTTLNETLSCTKIFSAKCSKGDILIDNGQCVNGRVQCLPGFARGDTYNCINVTVPVGGMCTKDRNCEDLNAICQNNFCTCAKETVTIKGKTYCKAYGWATRCKIPEVCFEDSICYEGICRCHFGYTYTGTTSTGYACKPRTGSLYKRCNTTFSGCPGYSVDRTICMNGQCFCSFEYTSVNTSAGYRCAHNASVHDDCNKLDPIVTKNAHCVNGTVVCVKGYRSGKIGSGRRVCAEDKSADFGHSCQAHFQCLRKTNNSLCSNNMCTCPTDYHYKVQKNDGFACMKPVKLGYYCSQYQYCEDSHSSCEDASCKCINTVQVKDRCVHGMSQGTIIGISVGVPVAIVAITIAILLYIKKRRRNTATNADPKGCQLSYDNM